MTTTVAHAALVWRPGELWNLSLRTSFKTWSEAPPRLLWFKDRKLTLEDLNTQDSSC